MPAPRSRSTSLVQWAARLLFVAGLGLLAWSALTVADALMTQRYARRALAAASHAAAPAAVPAPAGRTGVPRPAPVAARGSPVAVLSIPRLDMSTAVLHGADEQTLRRGPGHLENTALPGAPGNMVIAGHRDTFFRPLRDIRRGDDIVVDTAGARYHYRVTSLSIVNPRDVSVLDATAAATLTLITCYPFWVFGDAPDRFIVRAVRVDEEAGPPPVAGRVVQ